MKTIKVSKREMKHTSRGVFQYINKKPVKMLKGGHGERNINYLKKTSWFIRLTILIQMGLGTVKSIVTPDRTNENPAVTSGSLKSGMTQL